MEPLSDRWRLTWTRRCQSSSATLAGGFDKERWRLHGFEKAVAIYESSLTHGVRMALLWDATSTDAHRVSPLAGLRGNVSLVV